MIIGLDVDDVIFDTSGAVSPALEAAKDERLIKYKLDIMRGDAGIPEVKEFWQKGAIEILRNAKPKPGVAEAIRKLREKGNKIVLITARGEKNFPGTVAVNEEALKNAGIEYDVLIYDSPNKVEACRKNGVEIFVDDSPRNCVEVAHELGIPVIGFESDITREGLRAAGVASVDNWGDLENKILEVENGQSTN